MATIFSKIIDREIPAYIVAEDDQYIAFLDINPLKQGHSLVVPKKEVDYVFDLDHQSLAGLFSFSKRVAKAIESVIDCNRIGVAVMGLEVPHAHVHLIPINNMDDMNFANMKLSFGKEEMEAVASKIRQTFR
ncbi:MAG: HIT family protein [Ekhidna sp.]|nr:HIT family protein [Ekhidna sp.]MBC6409867.1 HIT family protein [Ekhidna sp.]MBC6425741.1 HIT family protein [Ekhidna sp.]